MEIRGYGMMNVNLVTSDVLFDFCLLFIEFQIHLKANRRFRD